MARTVRGQLLMRFCLILFLFIGLVGELGAVSPQRDRSRKKTVQTREKIVQKPSCDFKVKIKEASFRVIKGAVHDIDVILIPTAGVCKESATLSVSGLPHGATYEILPSPKMRFVRGPKTPSGVAVATVSIDTTGVALKEDMATSTIIFTASKKSLVRNASADMSIALPCDFKVELTEPNFCVIQGMVHDVDVTLTPTTGICEGPVTLNVRGLPSRATKKILPSPKMRFVRGPDIPAGIAAATVRIDTAGITLKEMATSSLTFVATKKDLTRTANADMMVDLPSFDFSLKVKPTVIKIPQESSATTTVDVKLLGAACRIPPAVDIALDGASLPLDINHSFSSEWVIPPEKTTLSFQATSSPEIGIFEATVVGCCTGEQKKKTAKITLDVTFPVDLIPSAGSGFTGAPQIEGKFTARSIEDIFKIFGLPEEAQEATRKAQKEMDEKGYLEASEGVADGLKNLKALARPIDQSVSDFLTFEPAPLSNTPFNGFKLEGGVFLQNIGERFASLIRIFTMPDGALVSLTELDYPTSGSGSVYAKESINENINGFPSRLVIYQSPSGKAVTGMGWETAEISYGLEMEGNVKRNGKYVLFLALARSITPKQAGGNAVKNHEELIPK